MQVFFIFIAEHAVHRVDGLVGQRQRRTADKHVKQRCNDAVACILGHGLHGGLRHAFRREILGITANNPRHSPAGGGQVAFCQLLINIPAFLHKPPRRKCLRAPEQLNSQPRQRVQPRGQRTDCSRYSQRCQRQHSCHDPAAEHFTPGRFGQDGPQAFFQRRDAPPHPYDRVGQPCRVPKHSIQHKAARHRNAGQHVASFVYCTVFTRCRICCVFQSRASSTKPPALGAHHS